MYKLNILLITIYFFVGCNIEHLKPISKPQSMTLPKSDSIIKPVDSTNIPSIPKNITMLTLGDSYTIGESVMQAQSWPFQLQVALKSLNYEVSSPKVIARTGWTTYDLKTAISAANLGVKYDLVFLLIGVNNQYQKKVFNIYQEEFKNLLENAINLASGNPKHVCVISIPDYGFTPFGKPNKTTISAELDKYNTENNNQAIAKGVNYVNITDISRSNGQDLVAGDGLHPSAIQYTLWVERIIPIIQPYLP